MTDESANIGRTTSGAASAPGLPAAVDRATLQAELDRLRVREKTHTREGDAIAAARRRLPMVEVDATTPLTVPHGTVTLLDAFEGRRQLIAYYFMWWAGHPAAEQCEGCTWVTAQVGELSYLHSRGITYAVFCQGPYDESIRYRDFMGWDMPWYSALPSLDALLAGRQAGLFHLVCYLRDGDRVFETYWTKRRGAEAMDYSYVLMDLTVYGRQGIRRRHTMTSHRIGTRQEWLAARAELLAREKELTRMGDELARQRRELPWVPVEKQYPLLTEDGTRTLAELFDGCSQLVVYHFMFGPGYTAGVRPARPPPTASTASWPTCRPAT